MTKVKKVSVISVEGLRINRAKSQKHWESLNIKDNFYYVHVLFLLLGLVHFLPFSFFITANAYWMHKFRNVSLDDIYDASKRTSLQSHFASSITMCNSIPNSIFAVLSALFGYKIKAGTRILFTLLIMTCGFMLFTAAVGIDTDSWQTLFFYMTLLVLALIIVANAVLKIAVFSALAKFPPYFLNIYLFGEGCAAVFNSTLQVVTLAIGTSTITSAFIYYTIGSLIMGFTLVQFYGTKYNKYYTYFLEHSEEDTTRDMVSFHQLLGILKKIWPIFIIYGFFDMAKSPQTPIANLVVSENFGSGSAWNDVYFVPVVTYLLADICTLLGRVTCSTFRRPGPNVTIVISVLRNVICIPLLLLCNAQPRSHLPVLLTHDWEYMLVHWVLSFCNGYVFNCIYLVVERLVEPHELEDSYLIVTGGICTISAVMSSLAELYVDIL